MKIFSYRNQGRISVGIITNNGFIDINKISSGISDISKAIEYINTNKKVIENKLLSLDKNKVQQLSNISPALPLNDRSKVICVGLNYAEHAKEGFQEVSNKYPVFFLRLNSSFVTDGENLVCPKISTKYDYEAELAVVIGKSGRYINVDSAGEYIFGYTIANDGSVRDYQKRTPQWTLGKNFDRSGSISPFIITFDELPEKARGLNIRSILNSKVMQDGNTADMIYDLHYLISQLSEVMTLNTGDIILTGTPAGVGFARSPMVFMKDGDEIIIEIDKIGKLTNKVVAEI